MKVQLLNMTVNLLFLTFLSSNMYSTNSIVVNMNNLAVWCYYGMSLLFILGNMVSLREMIRIVNGNSRNQDIANIKERIEYSKKEKNKIISFVTSLSHWSIVFVSGMSGYVLLPILLILAAVYEYTANVELKKSKLLQKINCIEEK
jgi:hypothetical protein